MLQKIKLFFEELEVDSLESKSDILENILLVTKEEGLSEINGGQTVDELKIIQTKYFGKKGLLPDLMKYMGKVSNKDKPILGKIIHDFKTTLENKLNERLISFKNAENQAKLEAETIDVTLPGTNSSIGHKHPLTLIEEEIKNIFTNIGFTVVEGYEIEEDYYNFERLNIPKDHPAREMQDTFYLNEDVVLRTHTSPVQARIMDKMCPQLPVKIIAPGKVFRRDDDSTHSPMFHQIEGLMVDKNITFADLKGILLHLVKSIFGEERKIRLRPSYFPFTEPSAEVDVSCGNCNQEGCRVCGYTGWLEILGSGMVHPSVLEMAGYDPNEVSGFAFGLGIERVAMLKYGIDDMRLLFDNDLRFLEQF
ncbi:MAG: phenylalanine--tRNA ligase subunit alpha [Firmicutes bacterium]|nr:phenylalanine--tRNA ligase subunit alpha [Bacillota bacterium]